MRMMAWKMVLATAAGALLAACGGPLKYEVKGSAKAPEADAVIVAEVKKDAGMTTITIDAQHLAPPDRLSDGGKAFVVWTKGEKPKWHRVGALQYKDGDRKAHIEGASVPVTAFDLQVTVESDPSPEKPSDVVVLQQHVN